MLSLFTKLLNPETVFRIWDLLFLYSTNVESYKNNLLLISICYIILKINESRLMKCNTKTDVLLVINMFCKFNMYINNFIKNVLNIYRELSTNYQKFNIQNTNLNKLST